MVQQRAHYTRYLHHNIPSDWVIQNSLSGYRDRDGWNKSMSHFASMFCYSPLNTQVIFYNFHDRHFYDRALVILRKHNICLLMLRSDDSLHDQRNDNGPKTKVKNLYGNVKMNYMRHHGNLKFTPAHMNSFFVSTQEAFKLSSAKISQHAFKKTHILPLSPPETDINHQPYLAGTQQSNIEKVDGVGQIEHSIIAPIYM